MVGLRLAMGAWVCRGFVLFVGGVDRLLARSGGPTPGGVRARAVIDDRTRNLSIQQTLRVTHLWLTTTIQRHAPIRSNASFARLRTV